MWSSSSLTSALSDGSHRSEGFEDPVASRLALSRLLEQMFGGSPTMLFDRFVPLSEDGIEGGMSVVYPAWDRGRHRQVAIKVMKSSDDAAIELVRREARLLKRIAHPNVVRAHGIGMLEPIGVHPEAVFLVMEWIDGEPLGRWLRREPSSSQIIDVFMQAGRGLAAAHRAGVIHGDFKPNNVVLGMDGRARLIDFGLARDRTRVWRNTTPEPPWGTPAYMAPEQHDGRTDARSDQYCFCASVSQALDGLEAVAPQTAAVVERGRQDDPAQRYPTMRDLLAALGESLLAGGREALGHDASH